MPHNFHTQINTDPSHQYIVIVIHSSSSAAASVQYILNYNCVRAHGHDTSIMLKRDSIPTRPRWRHVHARNHTANTTHTHASIDSRTLRIQNEEHNTHRRTAYSCCACALVESPDKGPTGAGDYEWRCGGGGGAKLVAAARS